MTGLIDQFYEKYTKVAGLACWYELNVRLEADVVPELAKYSHENDFSDLEDQFLSFYKDHISQQENDLLIKARQLRNKIIHSDFKSANSKVVEAGGIIRQGAVHQMNIGSGEVKAVRETMKKEGGIFGWFLEFCSNGGMAESEDLFTRAIALVRRIGEERAMAGLNENNIEG